MGETYSVCVPLADLANSNHTVFLVLFSFSFPTVLAMDSSPPRKRQRICFSRGRGRLVKQRDGSGGQAA